MINFISRNFHRDRIRITSDKINILIYDGISVEILRASGKLFFSIMGEMKLVGKITDNIVDIDTQKIELEKILKYSILRNIGLVYIFINDEYGIKINLKEYVISIAKLLELGKKRKNMVSPLFYIIVAYYMNFDMFKLIPLLRIVGRYRRWALEKLGLIVRMKIDTDMIKIIEYTKRYFNIKDDPDRLFDTLFDAFLELMVLKEPEKRDYIKTKLIKSKQIIKQKFKKCPHRSRFSVKIGCFLSIIYNILGADKKQIVYEKTIRKILEKWGVKDTSAIDRIRVNATRLRKFLL
ncbi:MAG: hypothetical protein Q6363_010205 [Candidatus Njordarchaeota archaeon]